MQNALLEPVLMQTRRQNFVGRMYSKVFLRMWGIFKCLHFESEGLGGRDQAFVGTIFFVFAANNSLKITDLVSAFVIVRGINNR